LGRILGPKRDEETREQRKIHMRSFMISTSHSILFSAMKSRRVRWAGHVARMGEMRVVYRVLVGKREGKRLFGRPRHRWEDYLKIAVQKVGCGNMDWIELAQNRDRCPALVYVVMNFRVP